MLPALLLSWLLVGEVPRDLVPARAAPLDEIPLDVFDPAWILPEDLPAARAERTALDGDLVRRMQGVLAERGEPRGDDPRSFGDAVRSVLREGGDAAARATVLARLARTRPELAAVIVPPLRELLASERLVRSDWDPEHDDPKDAILFGQPLTLEPVREAPWSRIEGSRLVQQACVLVFADLEAIKQAENDYRAYPLRKSASYEAIRPVRDTHFRGTDAEGRTYAALRLYFRCDLPFPFSDYSCDLSVLNRVAGDGSLRCDIYSRSPDFLWLAGRDVFLPVRASDGEWVATLIVRWFGFDLRGVPDGDDARRTSLRSSLGSLKREAETLFRVRGGRPGTVEGRVPEFDVRGGR